MRWTRFRLGTLMIAVAVAAIPIALIVHQIRARQGVERERRTKAYRQSLEMFGLIGSRDHFATAKGFRAYLKEVEEAELHLGVTPRRFKGASKHWTDEDERRYLEEQRRLFEPFDPSQTPAAPSTNPGETRALESGLKYSTVKPGDGPEARPGQVATIHYIGTFTDCRKFDSSRDRGAPFNFFVGSGLVIKGLDEGIFGMRVGETRRLIIPPHLAYGHTGQPPHIPSDATLVYEVELIEVAERGK